MMKKSKIVSLLIILFLCALVEQLAIFLFVPNVKANPSFSPRTETYVNLSSLSSPYDITVTKPTGTANGDILFCWIGWYASPGTTIDSVPSGWNLLGEYLANTDRYALYYKIASGEGASWAWSFAATAKVRAVCSCYTSGDFNPSNPINVVSNTAYRTSNTACIAASMNVASANSPMVFWGGVYYTTSSITYTKPSVPTSNWVEDDDAGSATPDFYTEVCSMIWGGSGATGGMSATMTVSRTTKHAFAVALNPSAISITLATTPVGCNVRIDGGATWYAAPHAFTGLAPGSSHSIEAQSPYVVTPSQERYIWVSWSDIGANPHSVTLTTSDTTYTATMTHQYQPTITLTGTTSSLTTSITARTLNGTSNTPSGLYTSWSDWCDSGTTLTFSDVNTGGGSATERLHTVSTRSWMVSSAFSATITYIHQWKPTITLTGTTSSLTTSITVRTLDGSSNTPSGLYTSWNDWCDHATTLTFSTVNTGGGSATERLHTVSTVSWSVTSAFSATITYVHQWKPTITLTGTTSSLTTSITVRTLDGSSNIPSGLYTSWTDWCDDSTSLTFSDVNTGGGSGTERLHTISTRSWTVTSALTATITYVHQWSPTITLSGTTSSLTVSITVRTLDGSSATASGLYTSWSNWCDDSTTLTFSTSNTGGGSSTERIHTVSTVSWSVTSALSQTITYIHQWKPTITLGGTLSGDTVNITVRTLDGSSATASGLYTSWNDWCDDSTTLTFSATSTSGRQCRSTTSRTWSNIASGFSATIIWDRFDFVSIATDTGDNRINVGANFELRYQIRYDYGDLTFSSSNGTVTGFTWDVANSWWDKTVTGSSSVTSTNYDETYITITDTSQGITAKQDVAGVDIITDRIRIDTASLNVVDGRIDISTEGVFYCKASLEYIVGGNHTLGNGDSLTLGGYVFSWNASTSRFEYKPTQGSVTSITINTFTSGNEATYSITVGVINSNTATIIWDRIYDVVPLGSDDTRINVGATATITVTLHYDFDETDVTDGTVTINGVSATHLGSGQWRIQPNGGGVVTGITYNTVACSGNAYGITSVSISSSVTQVWDRIKIDGFGRTDADGRVNVNSAGVFWATASLEYIVGGNHTLGLGDSLTLSGYIFTWNVGNSRFENSTIQASVTSITINSFTSGNETTFSITVGNINSKTSTIIWDRIEIYEKDDPIFAQNTSRTESLSSGASFSTLIFCPSLLSLPLLCIRKKNKHFSKILCVALILLFIASSLSFIKMASASDQTVPSNSYVIIWFKARYDYDNASYTDQSSSTLSINGTLATYNTTGGYWQLNVTQSEGTYYYVVSTVSDGVYGLTTFYDGIGAIKVIWIAPGYNLNLRVMDYDLIDAISGALVYKDSDVKTSDANGWANWTLVSGTVQIKVQYYGFWVNGTFSLSMNSDKTIYVRCKLYDVTVLVQEGVQNAYLAGANVTVYNSTSVQGNKITSGVTGNNGQVQLLNLPNNTLTFTQYGGASYSLVIGNITQLVSSENQTITLTADQNNVNTNNNYSIIAFVGMTIPFKSSFVTKRPKKKMQKRSETNEGSPEEVLS